MSGFRLASAQAEAVSPLGPRACPGVSILAGLIFFFTIPYTQAISQDIYGKQKSDGIWKVWIPGRMRDDFGKDKPKELLESINPWFCFKNGFYFSILSAFNIGWRNLNVGHWITRMQLYE